MTEHCISQDFDIEVTEEKNTVIIKKGTAMFRDALEISTKDFYISRTVLPNGNLQLSRKKPRTLKDYTQSVMLTRSTDMECIIQEPVYKKKESVDNDPVCE